MTAAVQALPREFRGRLHRLHDALAKPNQEALTLLPGTMVRFRFIQSTAWATVAGLLGACFIAGLYWLLLQQHWYVHLGTFNHGSGLKSQWDTLFTASSWPDYRHALRDLGEPAVAVMGVRTLLAKPGYWNVRVGRARLLIAPLVLLAILVALAAGGTWLLDFGGPAAWAHLATVAGHPGFNLDGAFAWAGRASLGHLALGFVIGQALHRYWAPIGATLQGFLIDRAVDRAKAPGGTIPLWEKLPLAPPVLRERFAREWREDDAAVTLGRAHRRAITDAVVLITVITVVGAIAKFWIAHGHAFPYLAP